MLRRLRLQSRSLATVLLLSLVSAFASEAMPGHAAAGHDAACAPAEAIAHNEADHILRDKIASAATSHASHCLVCHWARSFRPLGQATTDYSPLPQAPSEEQPRVKPAPAIHLAASLTLRAPPASTVL